MVLLEEVLKALLEARVVRVLSSSSSNARRAYVIFGAAALCEGTRRCRSEERTHA